MLTILWILGGLAYSNYGNYLTRNKRADNNSDPKAKATITDHVLFGVSTVYLPILVAVASLFKLAFLPSNYLADRRRHRLGTGEQDPEIALEVQESLGDEIDPYKKLEEQLASNGTDQKDSQPAALTNGAHQAPTNR